MTVPPGGIVKSKAPPLSAVTEWASESWFITSTGAPALTDDGTENVKCLIMIIAFIAASPDPMDMPGLMVMRDIGAESGDVAVVLLPLVSQALNAAAPRAP